MAEERHEEQNEQKNGKSPAQPDRIVGYFKLEDHPLFTDQHGEAHTIFNGQALSLAHANRMLIQMLYEREGKAASNEALQAARRVLDMIAHNADDVRELYTRSAFFEGAVYYELRPGRVVEIDDSGWRISPEPPVLFRAVKNLKPLPDPEKGGTLDDLTRVVNLKTARDRRLFSALVTLVPLAHIPRPILQATGVMGSGKSTASRVVKRLLDPTANESVTIDRRDFLQKAAHAYVLLLDNQNSLPDWFQDTLCRLVTGESDSKRVLYTDDEDLIWSMKRAVLLNGINAPTDRADVQDRTLPVELYRLPDEERIAEDDFWMHFELGHPKLLGAIFTALSGALKYRHTVKLDKKPRLADWGLYAAALYESQGWGVGQFGEDWEAVKDMQHQGTLDGSIVAQAVLAFMRNKDYVEEPASKLHNMIEADVGEDLNLRGDKGWPKTGRTLWNRIKETTPLLESKGIRAYRSASNKLGKPIILTTNFEDDPNDPNTGDDKGDDNAILGDGISSPGPLSSPTSSPSTPDTYAAGDDNALGGRYFGATIGSSTSYPAKEIKSTHTVPDSNPDLSSPSSPLVALDLETTGLNPAVDAICLLQYKVDGEEPQLVQPAGIPGVLDRLDDSELILHNAAFDLAFLKAKYGWTPKHRVWDTMVLSQLAYAGVFNVKTHNLKAALDRELDVDISKDEQVSDWAGELTAEQVEYAKNDVRHLHELRAELLEKIESSDEIIDLEMALIPVMADMLVHGVYVDADEWRERVGEAQAAADFYAHELDKFGDAAQRMKDPEPSDEWCYDHDFNWGSPKDVTEVAALHGIDLPDTKDETLATFDHEFIATMRRYRKYSKLTQSFGLKWIENVGDDGIVRANWKQAVTDTGRFACSDPNLQQLPNKKPDMPIDFRSCIKPRPGYKFIVADYSQVELRVAAVIAGEKEMIKAYNRGDDLHILTAKRILGKDEVTKHDRQIAKSANFGLLFGMGAPKFQVYARTKYDVDLTLTQAAQLRQQWMAAYPAIKRWHIAVGDELREEDAASPQTKYGRVRGGDPRFTEAVNMPVQGLAADGLKLAMVDIHRHLEDARIVLVVHDEVVVEVPEEKADLYANVVKEDMERNLSRILNAGEKTPVPIVAEPEVTDRWEK